MNYGLQFGDFFGQFLNLEDQLELALQFQGPTWGFTQIL
jgi:hypothetical protein